MAFSDNNFRNMISAATATALAELITLPICTIKTNYQNVVNPNQKISMKVVIMDIYNRDGIRSFYKASYPAILGQMFSTTSKYVLYKYLDTNKDYPIKNKFLNGMTAGILSSLITHPLDVIRVHLQMGKNIPKVSISNFYLGYSKTLFKITVSSSLFFPLYEIVKSEISNPIFSATVSGIIATICMHPIDYLKTRQMTGLKIYNGLNPLNYYRGLTLNLLRIVPHFAITMSLIEYFNSYFLQ